jgi:hypothetical protein
MEMTSGNIKLEKSAAPNAFANEKNGHNVQVEPKQHRVVICAIETEF